MVENLTVILESLMNNLRDIIDGKKANETTQVLIDVIGNNNLPENYEIIIPAILKKTYNDNIDSFSKNEHHELTVINEEGLKLYLKGKIVQTEKPANPQVNDLIALTYANINELLNEPFSYKTVIKAVKLINPEFNEIPRSTSEYLIIERILINSIKKRDFRITNLTKAVKESILNMYMEYNLLSDELSQVRINTLNYYAIKNRLNNIIS